MRGIMVKAAPRVKQSVDGMAVFRYAPAFPGRRRFGTATRSCFGAAAPVNTKAGSMPTLEIAHVLFTDIVGYSKKPMEEQRQLVTLLQSIVKGSGEYQRARSTGKLFTLPTGDGMALVFMGDPEAPVHCAIEIGRSLRSHPEVKLRMGIHTGPVYRVDDINDGRNVAGGGINIAQRVMDCGDANHILVSSAVADFLLQLNAWRPTLHDLGEVEVKHGVRVHVFNLFTSEAGNPEVPQKLRATARRKRNSSYLGLGSAVVICAVLAWVLLAIIRKPATSKTSMQTSGFDQPPPVLPEALRFYSEGLTHLRAFDPVTARSRLESATKIQPNFALAHSALADALSALGYYQQALDEAKTATELSGNLPRFDQLLIQARSQALAKDWTDAIPSYEAIHQGNPGNLDYGLWLAATQVNASRASDARATLAKLRRLPKPLGEDARIDVLEAEAALLVSDFDGAKVASEHAEIKAQDSGSRLVYAKALELKAEALMRLEEPTGAAMNIQTAAQIYETAGDHNSVARTYLTLTKIEMLRGRYAEAERMVDQSLSGYQKSENEFGLTQAMNKKGLIQWKQGHLREAKETFSKALMKARQIGERHYEAVTLGNIGLVMADQGDLMGASAFHQDSVAKYLQIGDSGGAANELNNLANVLYQIGDLRGAKDKQDKGLTECEKGCGKDTRAFLLSAQGEVFFSLGDLAASRHRHEQALELWQSIDHPAESAYEKVSLAALDIATGNPSAAEGPLRNVIEELRKEAELDDEVSAEAVLMDAFVAMNRLADASHDMIQVSRKVAQTEKPETRFRFEISAANVMAAKRDIPSAMKKLQVVIDEADAKGYFTYSLQAKLALGRLEASDSRLSTKGQELLGEVQRVASDRGFGQISSRASALREKKLALK